MRCRLCRVSAGRSVVALALVLGVAGDASAQGSNVDIAPVDVSVKKRPNPIVRRPRKPVATRPLPEKPVATRQAVEPRAPVRVAVRPTNQPSPVPAQRPPAPGSGGPPIAGPGSKNGPPVAYAGGQVARGGNVGILGNKDFMSTPYSTSSYTEKTIRDQQAQSVAEVLTNSEPAVRAAIGNTNRYDAITVRGFRVDNQDFALNGMYGLVPEYRLNPQPLERVELLRGPASFLYGISPFGVIGGTVNAVTKRALDEPLTRLTTFYLSTTRAGEAFDISRRYGDQKQLGVRVNGTLIGGSTTINRQRSQAGGLSVGADYTGENIRLYEDIIYQNDSFTAQSRGYLPSVGIRLPAAPDPRTNIAQDFDYSFATSITTLTRAEYDLGKNITVYGAVGVNRFVYNRQEDPGATLLNSAGDALSTSRFQRGSTLGVSGQIGGRVRFDTGPIKHEGVISADSLDQTFRIGSTTHASYQTNIYRPVLLSGLDPLATVPLGKSATNRPQSVGVGDTLSVLDERIQLTLGVRRQQIGSANYSPGGTSITSSSDVGATSPAVALLLRPAQALSFYGNFIEGLTVVQAPSSASNSNQIFPPAKATQYEAGTKLDLGRIAATLAFFQITQQVGITAPVTNLFTIAGQQRNRGIEFYTFGEIWRDLRVVGGVALLDPRLVKTAGDQFNGNFGVGAPRLQSNVGIEWDTPFVRGLTAVGRAIYTSRAFVSLDNLQSVPDWATLDLGLRYQTLLAGKPIVFRATVTNVLDNYYFIGNPTGYVISGAPRTLLASMSTDF